LPVATAKQVRIRTDVESGLPPVNGDQARLEQIVWNLLSNAVKFTPPGGRVELALARSGAHVEIRVEDSGQGIAGEFLPHLFERFRQADGSAGRRHGGLGLGLSIVKQLAELHGGSVRATSPGVDQGAVFSVMLPIEPGSERAATARRRASLPPERARSQPPRLPGVKLLVVDDEPDALAMIRHFCEEHGARVSSAPSSSNALELVRAERFDAIVSDIAMPGGDGYELMAAIRALGIRTPAVALTAFARREDRAKALSAGFQAHVTKPVDENELVRTIAQLAAPFQASVRA
jgi:CheY-like chemotaxis protein